MKLITNLRRRIARNHIRDSHKSLTRVRRTSNLQSARYIAVLYHLPDEDTYKKAEELVRNLSDKNTRVKVACFTELPMIPHYFIPKLLQDIVTTKDINWKFQPTKPFVKDFLEEEFDILIDLSLSEHLPLLYLAANSKAALKIGRFDEQNQAYFDLMIDLPPDTSLDFFIEQVMHYLTKINTEP